MNISTIYRLVIFALACAAVTSAQTTNGRTDMYYDSGTNTIYAVTSLSPDYNTQYYYSIEMQTYLDKRGLVQDFGYWTSEWGSGGAVAATTAEPGVEYTAIAYYYGTVKYMTYEVVYGCGNCYDWYDAYGYQDLISQGGPVWEGPTFSVWVWAAPIIITRVVTETWMLGDGGAKSRAPGQAPVDFDVAFRSFIPVKWVYGLEPGCYIGDGRQMIYNGNGRGFTRQTLMNVKTHSDVILLPDIGSYVAPYNYTGITRRYEKSTGLAADGQTLLDDPILNDCYKLDGQAFADYTALHTDVGGSTGSATAHFYGDATNPLSPPGVTPAITWNAYVTVSKATPQSQAGFTITATHDCFPAFEAYIGEQRIHEWTPTGYNPVNNIAYCLSGFGQIYTNYSGQVY